MSDTFHAPAKFSDTVVMTVETAGILDVGFGQLDEINNRVRMDDYEVRELLILVLAALRLAANENGAVRVGSVDCAASLHGMALSVLVDNDNDIHLSMGNKTAGAAYQCFLDIDQAVNLAASLAFARRAMAP